MGTTMRVVGSGGYEFDLDLPREGSNLRQIVDAHLAAGAAAGGLDLVPATKATRTGKPVTAEEGQ